MSRFVSAARFVVVSSLAATLGCATLPESPGLVQKIEGAEMSFAELRIRVRDFAPRFSGELETLADRVSARFPDPQVRREMEQFKINAVPRMQTALFQPDPLAALVDTWALLVQLQHALEERLAANGPQASVGIQMASERFGEMEAQVEALWREVTGRKDLSWERDLIHTWAREHPLGDSLATRESTAPLLAALTARSHISALGAASLLLETTSDLVKRVDVQSEYFPKQARWQAELLLRDLYADPTLGAPGTLVGDLRQALMRLDQLPAIVEGGSQRVLADLERQRLEVQGFVSAEREALLVELGTERSAAFSELEQTGNGWIDHAFDRAGRLVDRIFAWMLLLAALLVAGAIAVTLLLLHERRRSPTPPRRTAGLVPART